ncbi:MAG TPA: oligosaccharide flippase family protein [Anaerolineales bacterium]|nr:oligosaccharide flippase family protein [Anaerolineales bacterium]
MDGNSSVKFMKGIYSWGVKGGLGILDQVIFSGTNFLTSVFLARLLSKDEFGQFAVGLAFLTFFTQIYTSFALEPMSVLGPSDYSDRIAAYLMGQVTLMFLIVGPLAILLVLAFGLSNQSTETRSVLVLSSFSLPLFLFPQLMRRIFYVLSKPGMALFGSVLYLLSLLVVYYFARQNFVLNGVNSLLLISLPGLLAGLILLILLRMEKTVSDKINLSKILIETWSFGRWLVVSGALIGLATQSQIYLTGVLSNTEEAGGVRILQTFIQPIMLTSTAFSALATPAITSDFASGAYGSMRQKVIVFTLVLGLIALFYELLLILFAGRANQILFDGKYASFADQISVWGLVPILLSFFWGGMMSLQATKNYFALLIISTCWALFSFIPALIFIPTLGAWGATISIVTGFCAAFVSTWILYGSLVWRKYLKIVG